MTFTKSCILTLVYSVSALPVADQPTSIALSPLPERVSGDGSLNLLDSSEASEFVSDYALQRLALQLERLDSETSTHWWGHKRSNGTERSRYMDEKLSMDASVLASLTSSRSSAPAPTPALRGSTSIPGKVAFLFMLMQDVSMGKVWDKFFASAPPANYSIYTHSALGMQDGIQPLQRWQAKAINRVNTSWCALLGVEVALLIAALRDSANKQFVFVSQDAVPLKSFSYTYSALLDKPEKSKFCFASKAAYKHVLVEVAMNQIHDGCVYRDFYRGNDARTVKHHQWIVLSRDHATTIVSNAQLGLERWSQTWRVVAPDLVTGGEGCSDESVPATTLLLDMAARGQSTADTWNDLERMGVEQKCFTYVHWYNCWRKTKYEQKGAPFLKNIVDRSGDIWNLVFDKDFDFLKQSSLNSFPMVWREIPWEMLRNLVSEGFLFMRKMDPAVTVLKNATTSLALDEILPVLWEEVDVAFARAHEYSRLEGSGAPSEVVF